MSANLPAPVPLGRRQAPGESRYSPISIQRYSPERKAVEDAFNENDSERVEQYLPMMPLQRSISQQHPSNQFLDENLHESSEHKVAKEKNMDSHTELPTPTGLFTWVGFVCMWLALISLCISFSSPFWIQTYPHSFNEFRNIGLWEVCFDNYMHYRDQSQEHFTGCYWVFNPVIFDKLKEWLLPPWFIAVQVLVTGCLLLNIAAVFITALVFLHICPIISHEYYQTYSLFVASALLFLYSSTIVTSGFIFGIMCQDWEWMPRPDLNIISWSYGCLIIAGIFGTVAACCLYYESNKVYNELINREDIYAKQMLDIEIDAYLDSNAQQRYDPSVASGSYGGPLAGYQMISSDSKQPNPAQSIYEDKPRLNRSLDLDLAPGGSFDRSDGENLKQPPVRLDRAMPIPPEQHLPPPQQLYQPPLRPPTPNQQYQPRGPQPLQQFQPRPAQPYQQTRAYRPPPQSNFQPLLSQVVMTPRPQRPPMYTRDA